MADIQIDSRVTIPGAEYVAMKAEIERLKAKLNDRCPVDAMDRGMSPVEAAVWHVWGERCSDFEPECLTCKSWAEFDQIERLRWEVAAWKGRHEGAVAAMTADVTRLRADNERLKAALTPSAETKAAYWGEFHFTEEGCDEDGQMYYRKITVPWTTVKEIMAEILARAALAEGVDNAK